LKRGKDYWLFEGNFIPRERDCSNSEQNVINWGKWWVAKKGGLQITRDIAKQNSSRGRPTTIVEESKPVVLVTDVGTGVCFDWERRDKGDGGLWSRIREKVRLCGEKQKIFLCEGPVFNIRFFTVGGKRELGYFVWPGWEEKCFFRKTLLMGGGGSQVCVLPKQRNKKVHVVSPHENLVAAI